MKKDEALERWSNLEPNQDPFAVMTPIPYKSKGSTYGADGIRLCGSREFIEACLSNLMPILQGENNDTRLQLTWNEVKPTEIKGEVKNFSNAGENAMVCYVQLRERGSKSSQVNNFFNVKG